MSNYPLNLAMDHAAANTHDIPQMSRTHQYRKVMKPLLERKRRARINVCLDELKDLMVFALQAEGENASKLEKADILELTVRHLQKLKRQHMLQANPALDVDRYRAGFTACASEVSRVLSSVPGVTITVGTQLMSHLGASMNAIDRLAAASTSPLSVHAISSSTASRASVSAMSPASDGGYTSDGRESASPISVGSAASPPPHKQGEPVWRPF